MAHARCYAKLDARTQVTVRVPQVLHCGRLLRALFEAPTVAGLARTVTLTCIDTSDHGDALRLLLAEVESLPDSEPAASSAIKCRGRARDKAKR